MVNQPIKPEDLSLEVTPELWDYIHRILDVLPADIDPNAFSDPQAFVESLGPGYLERKPGFRETASQLKELLGNHGLSTFFRLLQGAHRQRKVEARSVGASKFWTKVAVEAF